MPHIDLSSSWKLSLETARCVLSSCTILKFKLWFPKCSKEKKIFDKTIRPMYVLITAWMMALTYVVQNI